MIQMKQWFHKWLNTIWMFIAASVTSILTASCIAQVIFCYNHKFLISGIVLVIFSAWGIVLTFWEWYATIDMIRHGGKLSY
jgi:hypothetical protein